ncbi:MAG: tetratricopeptide repeat protein [Gemmatimonadetes bacterium]|nr:tetratricopeptide repeat protein [Gemmatimonadota bacterium]
MKRWSTVLVAAAILVPAAVDAQRPSNNMHTRSAETYLSQADREVVITDKNQYLTKALEAAFAGIEASPDNPRSWFQAGQAYLGMKDWAGADSAFTRAEQIYPDYAEEIDPLRQAAWIDAYNAGVTALQANNVEEAISTLSVANMLYDKRPEAMVTLGSLHVQQGDLARAETIFQQALSVLRGPERANRSEQELVTWAEDEITVSMRLANILVEQENFAAAEKVYSDLLASQPGNAMARANLAIVMSRAGKTEEAAAAYRELLALDDLAEGTLFNIGIGLFRAQDFGRAATAFGRVIALNPVSHESLYNLGQSLFAQSGTLEAEKDGATPARSQEITAELIRLNESLRTTAGTLLELDPTNRNAMMMLAQSQRSLAELGAGDADALRRDALATLEAHAAMPVEISNISVIPGQGIVQIVGRVTNLKAAPGSPITIRFSAIDREGNELAGEDITIIAPAVDESGNFQATISVTDEAAGWKYVVRS